MSALVVTSTRLFVSCGNSDIPTSLAPVVTTTDSFCLQLLTELNPRANSLHLFSKISISRHLRLKQKGLNREEEEKLGLLGFWTGISMVFPYISATVVEIIWRTKWLKWPLIAHRHLWNAEKSISTFVLNTCMVQYPQGHRPNFRLEPRGGERARQFIDCLLANVSDSHTWNMENRL